MKQRAEYPAPVEKEATMSNEVTATLSPKFEVWSGKIVRNADGSKVYSVLGLAQVGATVQAALKELDPDTWEMVKAPVVKCPMGGLMPNDAFPKTAPCVPGYSVYFQGDILMYKRTFDASPLLPRFVTVSLDGSWVARNEKSTDGIIIADGTDLQDITVVNDPLPHMDH